MHKTIRILYFYIVLLVDLLKYKKKKYIVNIFMVPSCKQEKLGFYKF